MSLVDAQVRRLVRKALEGAAGRMDNINISFERLGGANEVAITYILFSSIDGETKQEFPGIILVGLADEQAPIDALAMKVLGRVPPRDE